MINSATYEVSINAERQNIYREAWQAMMSGIPVDTSFDISSNVSDAWIRSSTAGTDPYIKCVPNVLSEKKLSSLKKKNAFFLGISRPTLENLLNFVYDSGFIAAISDQHGILLEVFGDNVIVESTKEGNWVPGADWSEASIGNNSIGTSIYLKEPTMVIGYQHYCRCCHNWSSAAAPIFNPSKEIIGSIALCGRFEKIHPHTLGMIIAAAHDIEKQLSIRKVLEERKIDFEYQEVLLNAISNCVVGIDTTGKITFCNSKTDDILNINKRRLIGENIYSILAPNSSDFLSNSTKDASAIEIIFNIDCQFIKCICSVHHIINQGAFNGTVLLISNYDSAVRMANTLVGMSSPMAFENMIGKNEKHVEMVKLAKIASLSDNSILILGESGTGKDVFAQSIHNRSGRRRGPYIAINCGAIPKELIASELFGYSDGAFTGAKKGGKKGKFEQANGGTLFLDEIGDMPLEQQVVLLRIIEESSLVRIGSSKKIPIDVRIISATSKNIMEEVKENRFRQDLFYRLNVFTIRTVPLRYRKDDIEELSNFFLQKLAIKSGRPYNKISSDVLSVLMEYHWPGNIRELQNILERAFAISVNRIILPEMLHFDDIENNHLSAQETPENEIKKSLFSDNVHEYKANMLRAELEKYNWNMTKVSESLNISRPTLYRWLKKFNIKNKRFPC